jgi:diguanylate cyclase (GGDEF)-like protein/PAS domain S-box-containing protein
VIPGQGSAVRVLLVEDNPGDVRLLREALRDSGREFDVAHVGRLSEGLQILEQGAFDVVLLDLSLPDSHGLETFQRLHAAAPHLAVVVLSGTSDELVAMETVHSGAQDYLVKGQADTDILVRAMLYAIQRQRSDDALRESENRYRSIVDTANEGVAKLDSDGRLEFINPRLCEILGYEASELNRSPFQHVVDGEHRTAWREQLALMRQGAGGRSQYDLLLRHRDGSAVWALISAACQSDAYGRSLGSLLMVSDVTQRKLAEEALEHQALHDALTGLPNRTLLHDRLEHAILQAQRTQESLALLLMDLDRFKEVNDAFGHQFGDVLLSQIGPRLQTVVRRTDTVARLGGDEFAFVLPGLGSPAEGQIIATQLATKIADVMSPPFVIEGQALDIGGSIGIALCPEHGTDWQTLMRRADSAMYAAKAHHTCYELFATELDRDAAARLSLTAALRQALANGELELYYQPKVDVRSGGSSCVEALLRWQHPQQGLLLPARFIGLAEQTGLIRSLGLWVLEQALEECRS